MSIKKVKTCIANGQYAKALAVLDSQKKRYYPFQAFLRGKALVGLQRYKESIDDLLFSAKSGGAHAAEAWLLAGISGHAIGRIDSAIEAYERALALDGSIADARKNLCGLLVLEKRLTDARPHADWLMAHPKTPAHMLNAAAAYAALKLWDKALIASRRVLEAAPSEPRALSIALISAQFGCDWELLAYCTRQLSGIYGQGRFSDTREKHFNHIAWCMDQKWNLAVSRAAVLRRFPEGLGRNGFYGRRFSRPLRVGYVSGDFREHAFLYLTVGMFERHDPNRIQVFFYCFSQPQRSWYRSRFESAAPNLVRIDDLSDDQTVQRIQSDNIDVLVDCMGFTRKSRQGIFARRPAPLQVIWLGFPGTTGADYFDYIISDPVVTPDGSSPYFSEHLCRLPETYFSNDQDRFIAANPQDRADHGLPAEGVVFCCMNQAYKLEPVRFATFMAILKDVPGSLFWLLDPQEPARANIRLAARDAGIDPDRLVFAEKVSAVPLHLARLGLADLALDTRIYTGHTTTADALWAGVPVVATRGSHFASRVTESLLRACNVPEWVSDNEAGMHALAVRLALNPEELKEARNKLIRQRLRAPLFDTERYTRHMETAFEMMADRAERGLPPAFMDVPALPPRNGAFASEIPCCTVEIRRGCESDDALI